VIRLKNTKQNGFSISSHMVVDPSTPAGRKVKLSEVRWLFSGETATGHCTSCIKLDRVSQQL
jgi:hypothetical protein